MNIKISKESGVQLGELKKCKLKKGELITSHEASLGEV